MKAPETAVGPEIPHQIAALMRKVEKAAAHKGLSFAFVVLDHDGEPYKLTQANRTGLVHMGSELLMSACELEMDDPCACETCDANTARARLALKELGIEWRGTTQ